jgi:hypothetical protein
MTGIAHLALLDRVQDHDQAQVGRGLPRGGAEADLAAEAAA